MEVMLITNFTLMESYLMKSIQNRGRCAVTDAEASAGSSLWAQWCTISA